MQAPDRKGPALTSGDNLANQGGYGTAEGPSQNFLQKNRVFLVLYEYYSPGP